MKYIKKFESMDDKGYEEIDVETYIDGIRPECKLQFKRTDEYIVRKLVDVGKKHGFIIESDILSTKNAIDHPFYLRGIESVSYTHLTLPTKRIV